MECVSFPAVVMMKWRGFFLASDVPFVIMSKNYYRIKKQRLQSLNSKEVINMITESWSEKMKLKELVDAFANLADEKDAAGQGELFTEQGVLEFQVGFDGELQKIEGPNCNSKLKQF